MKVSLKYCELLLGPELVLEAEDIIFRNWFCAHKKCDKVQLNKDVSNYIENVTKLSEIELHIAFFNISLVFLHLNTK